MVFSSFYPDWAYNDIYLIKPEMLCDMGIKAVLFDIDNTIAPYEVATPTQQMKDYFSALQAKGIQIGFVSNNKGERVSVFNKELGFFCVCNAKKPFPKGMKQGISHFGLKTDEVLAVGDQIFTDCIAAHKAGIKFILVKPIKDKKTLFFRFKRFMEKPFVKNRFENTLN